MDRSIALHSAAATLGLAALAGLATAQDQTIRVSSTPSGAPGSKESWGASVSGDGRYVAFTSASDDFGVFDTNGFLDVYVYDRDTVSMVRASVASDGSQGNGGSFDPCLSPDGRYVAFASTSSNFQGGGGGTVQIYVRDFVARTTTLVSADAAWNPGNGESYSPRISADGSRIVFSSFATNLDPADTNGNSDIYVRDLVAGTTALVSCDSGGVVGNRESLNQVISPDGKLAAFASKATNFPGAGGNGAWLKDLDTGTLERIDVDSAGNPTGWANPDGFTDDGTIVAFSTIGALVPEDTNGVADVYLLDRTTGVMERVSVSSAGGEIFAAASGTISGDGRYVGFLSDDDAATFDDHNGYGDLFVRDRTLGITTLVTRGTLDERISEVSEIFTGGEYPGPWMSSDGSAFVFVTQSPDLVSGDTTGLYDVFLRSLDRHAATSSHYGSGWPGSFGAIPTLTPGALPYRGTMLDVGLTNSSGADTFAIVLVGLARSSLHTGLGGTLLVASPVVMGLPLPAAGGSFSGVVPTGVGTNELVVDLQALELDAGASKGVSFSDGLELVLGDS